MKFDQITSIFCSMLWYKFVKNGQLSTHVIPIDMTEHFLLYIDMFDISFDSTFCYMSIQTLLKSLFLL